MEASQRVVNENGEIIASLMKQDYAGGIGRSSKALGMMQRILMEQDAHPTKTTSVNACSFRLQSVPLPQPSSSAAMDGPVALFNRAIWFDTSFAGPDRGNDIVLAAVLLYNTGLNHHMQALQEGTGSNNLLKKALAMYTQVSDLLWSQEGAAMTPSANDISLLSLALMNNMAHIHAQWMDLPNVWECLEDVEEEMDCLGDGSQYLTDEEYTFFSVTSVIGCAGDSFQSCPAA